MRAVCARGSFLAIGGWGHFAGVQEYWGNIFPCEPRTDFFTSNYREQLLRSVGQSKIIRKEARILKIVSKVRHRICVRQHGRIVKIMLSEHVKNWRNIIFSANGQYTYPAPFPLAAPYRRSAPDLPLLVQRRGRFLCITCKVHRGKGLSGRLYGALDRLIQHLGPYPSTEGSGFGWRI
jgi:hypothetical protein